MWLWEEGRTLVGSLWHRRERSVCIYLFMYLYVCSTRHSYVCIYLSMCVCMYLTIFTATFAFTTLPFIHPSIYLRIKPSTLSIHSFYPSSVGGVALKLERHEKAGMCEVECETLGQSCLDLFEVCMHVSMSSREMGCIKWLLVFPSLASLRFPLQFFPWSISPSYQTYIHTYIHIHT